MTEAGRHHDPVVLPDALPVPIDDGACDHLTGARMPPIGLPSTAGGTCRVDRIPPGFERLVLYAFPKTGRPGIPPAAGWDEIPGARGCTPESCGFRDHAADLAAVGVAVAGISVQDTAYQREAVERLRLPFPLLSDEDRRLASALRLPTFEVAGEVLLRRLTLVVRDGLIERVFYPVFPPDEHAAQVLAALAARTI